MNFVVGLPRSGTSFTTHLLNAAGKIVCLHEHLLPLTGFQILTAARQYYEGKLTADELRPLLRCYDQRPQIGIDCNFILAYVMPVLLQEYPHARIVHLIRDPRNNVRSCYNELDCYGELFANPQARQSLIRWCVGQNKPWLFPIIQDIHYSMPDMPHADWGKLSRLEKNCVLWTESHRLILGAAQNRAHYLAVRVEDLWKEEETALKLFNFLSAPAPDRERLRRVLSAPVNSKQDPMWSEFRRIKKEAGIELLPEYSEWNAEQQSVLTSYCGELATQFGYALS